MTSLVEDPCHLSKLDPEFERQPNGGVRGVNIYLYLCSLQDVQYLYHDIMAGFYSYRAEI